MPRFSKCSIDKFLPGDFFKAIAERVFVDSRFWVRCWHCHQLPERSFFIRNRQFKICIRCTGIALGIISLPLTLLTINVPPSIYIIPTLAMLADGGTQALGLRKSNHRLRFITGMLFPWSLANLTMSLADLALGNG